MDDKAKEFITGLVKKMGSDQQPVTLGVSIYPEHSTMEKDKAYLSLAAKYGFTRVFTCLLSVGDDIEQIKAEFTEINAYAHTLGMQVIFDVNPMVFSKLGVVGNDLSVFKEMHADGLRLDMGTGAEGDANLSNNPQGLIIEINTSTSAEYIPELRAHGANIDKIWTCHNFYPQLYTGLGFATYLEQSKAVQAQGVKVATFVSSNQPNTYGPWPVSEGLATVEIHRGLPIDLQVRHLIATKVTEDILIGNAYASEEELQAMSAVPRSGVTFRVDEAPNLSQNEKDILYHEPHIQRELSDFVRRDIVTRFLYGKNDLPANNTPAVVERGDIIVVNDNLLHYRGELQIALQTLKNDGRYNVLGRIKDEEMMLLDELTYRDTFRFIK